MKLFTLKYRILDSQSGIPGKTVNLIYPALEVPLGNSGDKNWNWVTLIELWRTPSHLLRTILFIASEYQKNPQFKFIKKFTTFSVKIS